MTRRLEPPPQRTELRVHITQSAQGLEGVAQDDARDHWVAFAVWDGASSRPYPMVVVVGGAWWWWWRCWWWWWRWWWSVVVVVAAAVVMAGGGGGGGGGPPARPSVVPSVFSIEKPLTKLVYETSEKAVRGGSVVTRPDATENRVL